MPSAVPEGRRSKWRSRKNAKKPEPALDQVAKLQEAVAEERRKVARARAGASGRRQAVKAAREAYIEAVQRNETGAEEHEALRKADEQVKGSLDLRIVAQGRRIRDAEAAVQRFVTEHFSEVCAEKLQHDRSARDRVVKLVDQLVGAIAFVKAEAQASDELVRLAGLTPRIDGPPASLGLEGLSAH